MQTDGRWSNINFWRTLKTWNLWRQTIYQIFPQDCLIVRISMQEKDRHRHNTFQNYFGKDGPKSILLHYRKDKRGTEQNVESCNRKHRFDRTCHCPQKSLDDWESDQNTHWQIRHRQICSNSNRDICYWRINTSCQNNGKHKGEGFLRSYWDGSFLNPPLDSPDRQWIKKKLSNKQHNPPSHSAHLSSATVWSRMSVGTQ